MTTFAARHHHVGQPAQRAGVAVGVRWALACTAKGGAAELSICVDDRRGVAVLREADGTESVVGEGGPVRVERVGEVEHLDVPGVVSLSVRRAADGRVELLYARTGLLEVLGVPGGCAERPELVEPAK